MHEIRFAALALSCGLLVVGATTTDAQAPVPARAAPFFRLQGEASTYGELYGISGRQPRRPGATGRVAFQPVLTVAGRLRIPIDLQLTTEDNAGRAGSSSPMLGAQRQRVSRLGVSPAWGWGRLDLGDFAESYTPLTFDGTRVRGAGTALNPGLLRLGVFGGQAQSAVLGSAIDMSYTRRVVGGRVGVGRADASFLDLIFVRAHDDAGSLPGPGDSAFVDPRLDDPNVDRDTLPVGTLLNPLSVTPQENAVTAATGRLVLLGRRLSLRGELSGSGYNRDVRARALDNDALLREIPGFLRGTFTPRVGASFGVAYTAAADVRLSSFQGSARVRRVDPGYMALGVASLLNDQDAWEVRGTQRLGRSTSLRLDAARQHDNLIGQKAFTTRRARYGGGLTVRPTLRWTTSLLAQYVGIRNGLSTGDARWIAYDNWLLTTNQTLSFRRDRALRSITFAYSYRNSGDHNPARAASDMAAHAANVRVAVAPSRAVVITPSVGLLRSTAADGWHLRETYQLASQLRLRNGRWTSSASLGSTEDRGIGALQTRLMSRYALGRSDVVTFSLRASRYRNAPNPFGAAGDFNERTVTLELRHQLGNGA